jgi:nucleoside-diphosphate-sugar epimerase
MIRTLEADTVFFGFGNFTYKIILDLLNKNQKIVCITNNKNFNRLENSRDLHFITYQNAINYKIISNTSIFTWKRDPNFIVYKDLFFEWLRSELFLTRRSFLLSSASVYKDSPTPLTESPENLEHHVDLNDKYVLELILADLMKYKNSAHINLRISNVYGANLDYGFIGSLIKSIKSDVTIDLAVDQEVVRDYIYVDDVSLSIQELSRIEATKEILNISTGTGTSINQILEIFSSQGFNFSITKKVLIGESFKRSSVLNCDELSHMISWKPVLIKQGIMNILKK